MGRLEFRPRLFKNLWRRSLSGISRVPRWWLYWTFQKVLQLQHPRMPPKHQRFPTWTMSKVQLGSIRTEIVWLDSILESTTQMWAQLHAKRRKILLQTWKNGKTKNNCIHHFKNPLFVQKFKKLILGGRWHSLRSARWISTRLRRRRMYHRRLWWNVRFNCSRRQLSYLRG